MVRNFKITGELLEKLDDVESLEELKVLAKEFGIEATDEELAEFFDEENGVVKLPNEDLELVAGGTGSNPTDKCPENNFI